MKMCNVQRERGSFELFILNVIECYEFVAWVCIQCLFCFFINHEADLENMAPNRTTSGQKYAQGTFHFILSTSVVFAVAHKQVTAKLDSAIYS